MMTSIDEHLDNYFSSLNPITRKIWNDLENVKKAYGEEEWNCLSPVQQEEILAKYMISDDIREKYAHIEAEETPEVFPRLRIVGGEKIVVDFENEDGWTWQDEHSGPFSWMNKSQQDLSLDDLDNLEEQVKKTRRGVSRSPERDASNANKRQYDASQVKGTNAEAAHTADEIFQKFGIAFSFGKDEEGKNEEDGNVEQPEDPVVVTDQFISTTTVPDDNSDSHSGFGSLLRDDNLSESYDLSSQRTSTISSTSSTNRKKKPTKHDSEAELCLVDDPGSYNIGYGGQVSPVYLEDPGESTTDHGSSFNSTQFNYDVDVQPDSPSVLGHELAEFDLTTTRTSVVSTQPTSTLHTDWSNNSFGDTEQPHTKQDNTEMPSSPAKTGFDFLDNW